MSESQCLVEEADQPEAEEPVEAGAFSTFCRKPKFLQRKLSLKNDRVNDWSHFAFARYRAIWKQSFEESFRLEPSQSCQWRCPAEEPTQPMVDLALEAGTLISKSPDNQSRSPEDPRFLQQIAQVASCFPSQAQLETGVFASRWLRCCCSLPRRQRRSRFADPAACCAGLI